MNLSEPLRHGEVALVGAGPGSPDLLTVAAMKLLADCDVVVYDALVSRDILQLADPAADWIEHGVPRIDMEKHLKARQAKAKVAATS